MINDTHFDVFPNLESKRLLLRKLILTDAPDIQLIRSDERVMNYMDSDKHLTLQHSQKFISENLKVYEQKKGIFWAIIEKASGKFIGDFAYSKIDAKNSRAEIGYTLKPEYWGMGYMKEALLKIISFGFSDLHCIVWKQISILKMKIHEVYLQSLGLGKRPILERITFLMESTWIVKYTPCLKPIFARRIPSRCNISKRFRSFKKVIPLLRN